MRELIKAKEPFKFYTRLHLSELTGLKADTLENLLGLVRSVPGSSIYHHTHRFLQQHQCFSPEPPNDFAYWVTDILGEDELGERLASIDTIQYHTIHDLREKIAKTIEDYINDNPRTKAKFAGAGSGFYFIKSVSFIVQTNYTAGDLREFVEILKKITVDSIYFHIFEARLRLEKKTNDFSFWIETSLGDKELAAKISKIDPYTYTLEDLRKNVIKMAENRILS